MTEKPRKRGRPAANPELNADQKKMANELGVSLRTVQRWAGTHQEIMSDPDLVHMTETLEGYQKAKKILKERKADQKAQEAPIKEAKQMQSALKKWESLSPQEAEDAFELLVNSDFYDRTYAMLNDANELYIKLTELQTDVVK